MNQRGETKRIRRRRRRRTILILLILTAAVVSILASLRIDSVEMEGNEWYTQEELEEILFPDSWSRNPFVFALEKKKEIPFVEKYTATLTSLHSAEVIIYEREIIGCVVKMGSYLYFDRDGYIVESSSQKMENVPEVTGLNTHSVVLGEPLPIEDDSVFAVVLNVSQYLQEAQITWEGEERTLISLIDRIELNTEGSVTCVFGDISVYLGGYENMEEKLLEMTSILPELDGRSGTLYLNTYSVNAKSPSYVFK